MKDSIKSIRKMSWLSSYSRKILMTRLMLRTIEICDVPKHSQDRSALIFSALRCSITSLSLGKEKSRMIVAPNYWNRNPVSSYLKHPKSSFNFNIISENTFDQISFQKDMGTRYKGYSVSGNETHKTVGNALNIFYHEVQKVSRGLSLSQMPNADTRCDLLKQIKLWPSERKAYKRNKSMQLIGNLDQETGGAFTFWHDWYQGFLDGKPLDWNLQREVALIPDADWEKGPAHIAGKIEEIKARFLADKAPLAEKLELNPKTGKFFVTPIPARKPDLLNTTLEKTADALDDALNGRNGLSADDRVARVLRRCFEKYTQNPERIEMDFVDAHAGLTRQIASGELADSEEILSLAEVLKNGALDIRANHPDIAANRETRAAQALQELTPEQKQQLADAQPILEAITEGEVLQDMGADIPALINDMIGPVPDYAPPVGPAVRVVNRAAKMSLLASSKEAIETIEKNSGFRMVRISLVLKSIIDIGLKIFGLF
jgi:hypothetical protein